MKEQSPCTPWQNGAVDIGFPAEWVEALDRQRLKFIESVLEVTRFFEYTQLSPTEREVIFQSRSTAGPL